jgi:hypothetical protein
MTNEQIAKLRELYADAPDATIFWHENLLSSRQSAARHDLLFAAYVALPALLQMAGENERLEREGDKLFKEIEDHAFVMAHVAKVVQHVADGRGIHAGSQFDALMDDVRGLATVTITPSKAIARRDAEIATLKARAEAAERAVANLRDDIQIVKESREHEATLAQRAIAERDALQAGVDAVLKMDSEVLYVRVIQQMMQAAIQAKEKQGCS